jgi:putative DNA primase/helicase
MAGELDAIPRELRERPQWVLYRVQSRNGKTTKVPYQAVHAGRRASSTDWATWATFEAAVAAHERGRGDGLGFVFTADDPFAGMDLDACVDADGVIDEHALELVERVDSYTELSPSGVGLHVIARAQVGGGRRTSRTPWGGELEVYDRDRYFTMTGRRFGNTPGVIAERDDALAAVRAEFLPELEPPAARNGNGASPLHGLATPERLDDRDLLERAFNASNGAKFRALWQGDTSGYKSQSEAELALVSMLAFWTGPDEHRIDGLFRQSGLFRPKWEAREEYRAATIGKALAGRTEFYGQPAPRLRAVATPENALEVASAAIRMEDAPLVAAHEQAGGRIILERADGLRMAAPSLESLTTFAKLSGALAAAFGHELVTDQKTATTHRFVAALRRHFGPAQVQALEQRVEGWFVDLARLAGEATFEAGDAEGRLRAWRALDELDPELERGAAAFARKVMLAHDLTTGDRYLRAGWAQEYMHRSGWRGSTEQAAGVLEAIGLEQPNPKSNGQVRARWRAGGETVVLRFWVIPPERFVQWRADS